MYKNDKQFYYNYPCFIKNADSSYYNDDNFINNVLSADGKVIKEFPEYLGITGRLDKVLIAIESTPIAYNFIDDELKSNPMVIELAKRRAYEELGKIYVMGKLNKVDKIILEENELRELLNKIISIEQKEEKTLKRM